MPRWVRSISETNPLRMIVWLLSAVALYAASRYVGSVVCIGAEGMVVPCFPDVQVALSKYANATGASYVAYWVARNALGRIDAISNNDELMARAILMGSIVLAICIGL